MYMFLFTTGYSISKISSSWCPKHNDRVWGIECRKEIKKNATSVWSPNMNTFYSEANEIFQCAGGNVITGKQL